MSNRINNAQPEPCRRRAVWAAQSKENDNGKRTSSEAVQERPNPLHTTQEIGIQNEKKDADEKAPEKDAGKVLNVCPKCGKTGGKRGMWKHIAYCKG